MKGAGRLALFCALGLPGCPTAPSEPPPPATKPEIVTAPPRALGAMAAGTDAAPQPEQGAHGGLLPTLPLPAAPEGGGEADAGQPEPDAGGLAPAQPDAGMAL